MLLDIASDLNVRKVVTSKRIEVGNECKQVK